MPADLSNRSPGIAVPTSSTLRCSVCGEPADGNHFRAVACKACAAFFRRSVAKYRRYTCRENNRCSTVKAETNRICSSCRLLRCVEVGMQETRVRGLLGFYAAHNITIVGDSPFREMICKYHAIASERRRKVQRVTGAIESKDVPASRGSLLVTVCNELSVLRGLFRRMDADFFDGIKDGITPDSLAESFLPQWHNFQVLMSTIANNGYESKRVYFVDGSYLGITPSDVERFFGTDHRIQSNTPVAKYCFEKFQECMQLTHRSHLKDLDEVERAALLQLLFAKDQAPLMKGPEAHWTMVNRTMKDLHEYYTNTYQDIITRIDAITTLVGELEIMKRIIDEIMVFIDIVTMGAHSPPGGPTQFEELS